MQIYHVTMAADGRLPLLPTEDLRRRAVRTIARAAGGLLVLFHFVDEHLHLVPACEPERIGRLTRAVQLGLRSIVAEPLEPSRIRRVESRSHLQRLTRYVLTQARHHGFSEHPALATGSCFQDLMGARHVVGLTLRIARFLPRFTRSDAQRIVGLPLRPLVPADDDRIFSAGLTRLVQATASAAAVAADLAGKARPVMRAKRAVAHLSRLAGFPVGGIARALQISPRGVHRLVTSSRPDDLIRAARIRLALEDLVASTSQDERLSPPTRDSNR